MDGPEGRPGPSGGTPEARGQPAAEDGLREPPAELQHRAPLPEDQAVDRPLGPPRGRPLQHPERRRHVCPPL